MLDRIEQNHLDRSCEKFLAHRGGQEWNIPRTIKRSKAVWIGHIWRRNCFLTHAIEGKIQERVAVTGS